MPGPGRLFVLPTDRLEGGSRAGFRFTHVNFVTGMASGPSWIGFLRWFIAEPIPAFLGRTPEELLQANVEGTLLLCEEGREAGIRKFVFASSIQVFASEYVPAVEPSYLTYLPLDGDCPSNPRNPYAFSKATSEMLIRRLLGEAGVQCQSLRFPG